MHILAISPGEGFEQARWSSVLSSGIDGLMLREKHLEAKALLELTRRAQELAPHLRLWVNGRLDVALAAGCGLHAPEHYPEIPPTLVPISRPWHQPAQFPERAMAQQLLVSPVFATPGKGPCLGAQGLHAWLDQMPSFEGQILALGGITPDNSAELKHPRLAGVALIRALWESPDPRQVVTKLREAWAS